MPYASITALDCGWMRTARGNLVDGGGDEEIPIPIVAWLVQHPNGNVVFDAGLDPDLANRTEPIDGLATTFYADLSDDGSLAPRLEQHDVDPAGELQLVISHGHFDHVGGIRSVPNARLLVQGDEWDAARSGRGYGLEVTDYGHTVTRLDGTYDIFDDGSLVCFRTPGHTCGHQSLRVQTADGAVVIAGDSCYFDHTLDDEVLPPFAYDMAAQRASLAELQRERARGTLIIPGHDAAVTRRFLHIPR